MSDREPLALQYRPRTFDEVAGQRVVTMVLKQMVRTRRVPPALLFEGTRGSGKTSTARILAAALNCENADGNPCLTCSACSTVRAGTSLDVIEVDAASHGLVDDIRRLRDLALYATPGSCRVVLLDEAHSMGRAAFDAVLKILEEPPDRTVFILLTTEPGRIPRTVASRCMPFSFRRVAPAVIQQRLAEICEREQISAEPGLLAAISSRADGGVRDAVMLLDQCWAAGAVTEEHLCQLTGEDDFAPNLIAAMLEPALLYRELGAGGLLDRLGDYQLIGTRLVGCLRDILVLHAGGEVTAQGTPLEARRSLAARLTGGQVVSAMSVLWSLRTKVRAGSDSRSGLELALVMASEALRPKAEAAVMNGFGNGNGHRPITLAELQAASAPMAPA